MPPPTTALLGLQGMLLMLSGIAPTPVIVLQAAGHPPGRETWVIFVALLISGFTTVLQGIRWGRFGTGYPLFMGTSGAFIAVGIAAVQAGVAGWSRESVLRLQLVAEEAILFLREHGGRDRDPVGLSVCFETDGPARLLLETELDAPHRGSEIAALPRQTGGPDPEPGLRILRRMASAVEHEQFTGRSFLTLTVDREGHPGGEFSP